MAGVEFSVVHADEICSDSPHDAPLPAAVLLETGVRHEASDIADVIDL